MSTFHDRDPQVQNNPGQPSYEELQAMYERGQLGATEVVENIGEHKQRRSLGEWIRDHKITTTVIAIGTTAAGAVLGYAVSRGPSAVENGPAPTEPVATASANPGASEQPPLVPSSPVEAPKNKFDHLTPETFPYNVDGKIVRGKTALQAEKELRVEDYEEEKFAQLPIDTIDRLNSWMSSGADKNTIETYAEYESADGRKGAKAIATLYDEAYEEILVPKNDEYFNGMMTGPEGLHANYIDKAEKAIKFGGTAYRSQFQVLKVVEQLQTGKTGYAKVMVSVVDNEKATIEPKASLWTIRYAQEPGSDGSPRWVPRGITIETK